MIKVESIKDKRTSYGVRVKVRVETSIPDDLILVSNEVFVSELVAIFKQLHTINPQILLDALEVYREDLANDKTDFNNN